MRRLAALRALIIAANAGSHLFAGTMLEPSAFADLASSVAFARILATALGFPAPHNRLFTQAQSPHAATALITTCKSLLSGPTAAATLGIGLYPFAPTHITPWLDATLLAACIYSMQQASVSLRLRKQIAISMAARDLAIPAALTASTLYGAHAHTTYSNPNILLQACVPSMVGLWTASLLCLSLIPAGRTGPVPATSSPAPTPTSRSWGYWAQANANSIWSNVDSALAPQIAAPEVAAIYIILRRTTNLLGTPIQLANWTFGLPYSQQTQAGDHQAVDNIRSRVLTNTRKMTLALGILAAAGLAPLSHHFTNAIDYQFIIAGLILVVTHILLPAIGVPFFEASYSGRPHLAATYRLMGSLFFATALLAMPAPKHLIGLSIAASITTLSTAIFLEARIRSSKIKWPA